ncbi:MAG: hypothetical protein ACK47B_21805 [Armatimonadota bacterium]
MGAIWRDQAALPVVIANLGSKTPAIELKHYVLFGLAVPAAFEGTVLTFEVCDTKDGTFQPLYDDTGALVSLTVAAGRSYALPAALAAWQFCKVVSNNPTAADRTLTFVFKG